MLMPLATFILALVLVLVILPALRPLAVRVGLVDKPDNTRKLHRQAIPLIGGIVIFLAIIVTMVAVIKYFELRFRPGENLEIAGLLLGSTILVIVGILDDRFNLRGRQKLAGQILAVTVLLFTGYYFDEIEFAGFVIPFGIFAPLVIYAWCLLAINSVNLLDGADGFASTIGFVVSLSMAIMAFDRNSAFDGVLCLALAGALVGFLRFNFPPAKAYLGDTGSMLIGFLLAAVAIRSSFKQAAAYAVFAPVALLAIPLIDTGAAIIRRRFTGRSIYMEDRGHLHHVMAKQGLGPVSSLIWVALLCTMTACGAVLSLLTHETIYAFISIGLVIFVMISGKIFGVAEFRLLMRRVWGVVRSFIMLPNRSNQLFDDVSIRLQGDRDWNEVWRRLCEFAAENDLVEVMLDINAPWLHEGFHATWRKKGVKLSASQQWQVEVPLVAEGRVFGRTRVHSRRENRISHHDIALNLLKVTNDIEELVILHSANQVAAAESQTKPKAVEKQISDDVQAITPSVAISDMSYSSESSDGAAFVELENAVAHSDPASEIDFDSKPDQR